MVTITCAATDSLGAKATATASASVSAPSSGLVTNFTSAPRARILIGGAPYEVETAGQSYSLTNPDAQTLRFELRAGDHAWFDSSSVDRAEVDGGDQKIPAGTPVNIAYQFMVEAGATNTAEWLVAGQMHNDDWGGAWPNVGTSPPFAVELNGEHLQVVARYCPTDLNPGNGAGNLKTLTLWTDPNPIQRGQYNDIKISANVSNTSSGYLEVWVKGAQVVNYHGPLGYGAPVYWEAGLYRHASSETIAANFRNMTLTTG